MPPALPFNSNTLPQADTVPADTFAASSIGPGTILADARWAGFHGIGRFAREVLRRLPAHEQIERGPRPLSVAAPLWLTWKLMTRRPAVFFSPGFNPPPLCVTPFVFTIHDLIQISLPEVATPAKRLYYQLIVRPACRRAYRVLTVSEHSRERITEWSGVPAERIVNVGNGVGAPFQADGSTYEPGFPYILYVGNCRPHKNLDRLCHAFRSLSSRHPGLHLVLATVPTRHVTTHIEHLGIRSRTHVASAVTDSELASLYRGALFLALPSLAEGFGLPALEAMACGTPVVSSHAAALREIVGAAGLFMDPLDPTDMWQTMDHVLGDNDLRHRMRAVGLQRAAQFSWDRVAAKVRAVLLEAAALK
jgi:glycosyltransferase involved in cell wall biosynthesis